jgi:hypothetical protein
MAATLFPSTMKVNRTKRGLRGSTAGAHGKICQLCVSGGILAGKLGLYGPEIGNRNQQQGTDRTLHSIAAPARCGTFFCQFTQKAF